MTNIVKAMYSKFPNLRAIGEVTDSKGIKSYRFEDAATKYRVSIDMTNGTVSFSALNDRRNVGIAKLMQTFGISPVTGESTSASPKMKAIITELARFSKDSGGKVEYDRTEGSYFISRDGDSIAQLRNDEADEFAATVKKYMREGRVDERTAQLAAAKGWIENAE